MNLRTLAAMAPLFLAGSLHCSSENPSPGSSSVSPGPGGDTTGGAQPESTAASAVVANRYDVEGDDLHVVYTAPSPGLEKKLVLTTEGRTTTFTGQQIEAVDTAAGALVSVRTRITVDTGSTTFSFFVPPVRLKPGGKSAVMTQGITTVHRFSVVPGVDMGQLDDYTFSTLSGTATSVAPDLTVPTPVP